MGNWPCGLLLLLRIVLIFRGRVDVDILEMFGLQNVVLSSSRVFQSTSLHLGGQPCLLYPVA